MDHWKVLPSTVIGCPPWMNSTRSRMVKPVTFWTWWQPFNDFFCFETLFSLHGPPAPPVFRSWRDHNFRHKSLGTNQPRNWSFINIIQKRSPSWMQLTTFLKLVQNLLKTFIFLYLTCSSFRGILIL